MSTNYYVYFPTISKRFQRKYTINQSTVQQRDQTGVSIFKKALRRNILDTRTSPRGDRSKVVNKLQRGLQPTLYHTAVLSTAMEPDYVASGSVDGGINELTIWYGFQAFGSTLRAARC